MIFLSFLFIFPSFSYFFPLVSNIYEPFLYYETHYNWIEFFEVGFSGVSTQYGYAIIFIISLLLLYYKGPYLKLILALFFIASYNSGSLLSLIFSSLLILNHYIKIKIYLFLPLTILVLSFLSIDQIYELGNQRFDMYNIFSSTNWFYLLIGGDNSLMKIDDLTFHNSYLTLIFSYGLVGTLLVLYIIKSVYKDVIRNDNSVTVLLIFFTYNLFEPSNIFGNWSTIIPFWWHFFNSKKPLQNVRNIIH
ncbi:MAG: hypothetical protein VYD59_01845 [Bacteroidota bacterium]|nr:hypothetical protein [Bacteroidota bacterium]